ncbi:MAG: hypothetical protein WCJ35_20875, partial [Planctomycetota bacterium]
MTPEQIKSAVAELRRKAGGTFPRLTRYTTDSNAAREAVLQCCVDDFQKFFFGQNLRSVQSVKGRKSTPWVAYLA